MLRVERHLLGVRPRAHEDSPPRPAAPTAAIILPKGRSLLPSPPAPACPSTNTPHPFTTHPGTSLGSPSHPPPSPPPSPPASPVPPSKPPPFRIPSYRERERFRRASEENHAAQKGCPPHCVHCTRDAASPRHGTPKAGARASRPSARIELERLALRARRGCHTRCIRARGGAGQVSLSVAASLLIAHPPSSVCPPTRPVQPHHRAT